MKTKIYSILAIAALLFTATGCSDNIALNDPTLPDGEKTKAETQVTVKLASGPAASRAISNPVTGTTSKLAFNGGHMYFTTTQGIITKYFVISKDEKTNLEEGNKILSLEDLQGTDGLELLGIPANSDSIFIIGNVANVSETLNKVGGHIRGIQSITIDTQSQNNASDGGIGDVAVYGAGKIVDKAGPNPLKKQAEIEVGPQTARIEIRALKYMRAQGTSLTITGYDVEAVYINNYYATMRLDSIVAPADSTNNGDVLTNYVEYVGGDGIDKDEEKGVSGKYKNTGLYDWINPTISTSEDTPATLGGSSVWAYNLLAPLKGDAARRKTTQKNPYARPHIIVRLNNITTNDDNGEDKAYTKPMYLTMRLADDKGVEIEAFEPGCVYQIAEVQFDYDNLYPRPEMTVIDVAVKVTLVDWKLVPSGVILN